MTAHAAHDLGLTLRSLVADLDPLRWKDERREKLAAEFSQYSHELGELLDSWNPEETLQAVAAKLNDVSEVLASHLPTADDVRGRWMEFRAELHPAYEELAEALKTAHMELPNVRPTNYWRSGFHILAGVLALVFVEYAPWKAVIAVPALTGVFFWSLEISRRRSERVNDFLMNLTNKIHHPHERFRVNSSTWFVSALFLLSLTHQPVVGAAAVIVLGFGDPAAGFIGRRWGRTQLVNGRTLEGTLSFAITSFIAVWATLSIWHPEHSGTSGLMLAGAAAIAGALTELFSRRVDDNFAIPMMVGLVVWLATALG